MKNIELSDEEIKLLKMVLEQSIHCREKVHSEHKKSDKYKHLVEVAKTQNEKRYEYFVNTLNSVLDKLED